MVRDPELHHLYESMLKFCLSDIILCVLRVRKDFQMSIRLLGVCVFFFQLAFGDVVS